MRSHPLLALATTTVITAGSALTASAAAAATPLLHHRALHARAVDAARGIHPAHRQLAGAPIALGPLGRRVLRFSYPRLAPRLSPHAPAVSGFDEHALGAIRACESRDDYAADTGNGYYGAYQFAPTTWWAIGFGGLPSAATPQVQDRAALELVRLEGFRPWPHCAAELGLST